MSTFWMGVRKHEVALEEAKRLLLDDISCRNSRMEAVIQLMLVGTCACGVFVILYHDNFKCGNIRDSDC